MRNVYTITAGKITGRKHMRPRYRRETNIKTDHSKTVDYFDWLRATTNGGLL
jgi:hypothetical protein